MKRKLAVYWAASCGGCDVSLLDLDEKILTVAEYFDLVLWPCAADFKYHHVEAMPDGYIDVCLFNGAIRTSEQKHIAELLRQKSKVLIAYGSCSHLGGIPGLANVLDREQVFERVYKTTPSTVNKEGVVPREHVEIPEGELELPRFYNSVFSLGQVVDVDYNLPGCPPPVNLISAAVDAIIGGNLPPKGSTIGPNKTLCDECPRERSPEKQIHSFKRPTTAITDPKQCLLEQGIFCAGPATRAGCGHRCINVNMPCRGCFGPPDGVPDQGAKLISIMGNIIGSENLDDAKKIITQLPDPLGTFYRFSLPTSTLRRKKMEQ